MGVPQNMQKAHHDTHLDTSTYVVALVGELAGQKKPIMFIYSRFNCNATLATWKGLGK